MNEQSRPSKTAATNPGLVDKLEHYNIVTEKLDETAAFYEAIIGLKKGYRPDFGFPGVWLYLGQEPVVHLMQLGEDRGKETGPLDHVAFRGNDYAAFKRHLAANRVAFNERFVKQAGMHQVFIEDPNGVTVEVNFRV
jgi:catechol 2,3-dioxygenase-like lactoylglutathione lyase family enzyme